MSPFEHGEVFVLDDGGEVVPHITTAIQDWIERVAQVPVDGSGESADVCVIELGGTVGDIESMPFVEALRQFQPGEPVSGACESGAGAECQENLCLVHMMSSVPVLGVVVGGQENMCLVHVSLVPVLGVVGEQKTKPTQHSVRELRALGLMPNLLACRSAEPLEPSTREKLSQFCHVPEQGAHLSILKQFQIEPSEPQLQEWAHRAKSWDQLTETGSTAMVGKYTGLSHSYLFAHLSTPYTSLSFPPTSPTPTPLCRSSLPIHPPYDHDTALACGRKLIIEWVASSDLEDAAKQERADGVLVPGGFGDRGVEGKILAANYARTNRVPYLGICLGMQIAVIEYARNVLGHAKASSTEFDPASPHPCIVFMPEVSKTHMGATMRLGARDTVLHSPTCLAAKLYGTHSSVSERHRHRYEVNPDMIDEFEAAGLKFVGRDESGRRMEILEIPSHPYFLAVQYHPEFKSRPGRPSPVFQGLILAASGQLQSYLDSL
ncbi:unnamed protein product [Closterium sp. NIES-64]|nr:unnamed protein product [Closterium sp. NIES-64]